MTRYVLAAIVLAFAIWVLVAVRETGADPPPTVIEGTFTVPPPPSTRDLEVAGLRTQLRVERRRVRGLRRTLMHRSSTAEAIELACVVYGSCGTLWRRARCESGVNTYARNASGATGLFQFLPSTWASTPYAGFSIWDPFAQALAAGWMEAHGRGGEWACQ